MFYYTDLQHYKAYSEMNYIIVDSFQLCNTNMVRSFYVHTYLLERSFHYSSANK